MVYAKEYQSKNWAERETGITKQGLAKLGPFFSLATPLLSLLSSLSLSGDPGMLAFELHIKMFDVQGHSSYCTYLLFTPAFRDTGK